MMFFRISSVPPAMRMPGEPRYSVLPEAFLRAHATRRGRAPIAPCSSIANDAISWPSGAPTALPIEPSGPGVAPRESADSVR